MGVERGYIIAFASIALALSYNLSFPCSLGTPRVSWSYEVSSRKGKEYRRVDVEIIEFTRTQVTERDPRILINSNLNPGGLVHVDLKNVGDNHIEDIVLLQVAKGIASGFIKARKILNRTPLIVEDFIMVPYRQEGENIYIGLASLKPGEHLLLNYKIDGYYLSPPSIVSPVIKKEKVQASLFKRYSIYFGPGQRKIDESLLIERIITDVSLLPYDREYRIRVKGYADSTGRRKVNQVIARERALWIVKSLLESKVACIDTPQRAESLIGSALEIR